VHPREAEILDCTHINLSVLSLDLLLHVRSFDVIWWVGSSEVAPHFLKLSFIWQARLVNEAHLNECLKCLCDRNQGFVCNIVVVINLLQVALKSFENDILRIFWHWLHFRNPLLIFFYFMCVFFILISSFCVIGKDVFYFRSPDNRLGQLVDLRSVSWLRCFCRSPMCRLVFSVLFLFDNLFAFFVDLGLELWSFCVFLFKLESKLVISLGFIFYLVIQKLLRASHLTPIIGDESVSPFILCLNFFLLFHLLSLFRFLL